MSTQIAVTERAAQALGVATLKPKLAELVAKSARIVGVTNSAGREECHRAIMELKTQRVAIEKTGKKAREDATKFSKAVIAAEKELVAVIEPEEIRLQDLRDDWDAQIERERQAKIEAERQRVEGIQKRIADISLSARHFVSHDAQQLAADLEDLRALKLEGFAEFADQAEAERADACATVEKMHAEALAREDAAAREAAARKAEAEALAAERAKIEAERAELARQQAEAQAAIDEANRLAAAQREREAAELRAKAEAEAAERRKADEAERAEREQAEAAQRAEREAQERAQREQEAREAEARRQAQEAEAKRLAEEQARLQAEREAFDAARRKAELEARQQEIAGATLYQAATEALPLLRQSHPQHIATEKLAAALSREQSVSAAA